MSSFVILAFLLVLLLLGLTPHSQAARRAIV
jgi:hypothetical protein